MSGIDKFKNGKQPSSDDAPSECWKAMSSPGSNACNWVLSFFKSVWDKKQIPMSWHLAKITAIFKKGDASECSNYRQISLFNTGYKLFAIILLNRLKGAGVESLICSSQFGFRSGVSTSDVLFLARCFIDKATAQRYGKLVMLALYWAKACDSISPAILIHALHRFGTPQHFVDIIHAIYSSRMFFVHDHQHSCHTKKRQHFGISQGCFLFPMLFMIMMNVLIHDARDDLIAALSDEAKDVHEI